MNDLTTVIFVIVICYKFYSMDSRIKQLEQNVKYLQIDLCDQGKKLHARINENIRMDL